MGWTDINGSKRFSKCKSCEIDRSRNRYSVDPIPHSTLEDMEKIL